MFFPCRTSVRTVTLYNTSNLGSAIAEVSTNISPATLVPFYDRDTKLLFLTGKVFPLDYLSCYFIFHSLTIQGDAAILAYEYVSNDPPYLFAVSSFKCGSAHQVCGCIMFNHCIVHFISKVVHLHLQ